MNFRLFLLGLAISLLTAPTGVFADEKHSADRIVQGQGDGLSMTRFYTGEHVKVGTYPGKLVCLRCDLGNSPNAMKQCATEGHQHALSMEGGAMIHPLVAGTRELGEQINSAALHGKSVNVHGNYYPTIGWILVDQIQEAP